MDICCSIADKHSLNLKARLNNRSEIKVSTLLQDSDSHDKQHNVIFLKKKCKNKCMSILQKEFKNLCVSSLRKTQKPHG